MPSTLAEEPEELCSIVKAIVQRSSPTHLNQVDNRQRTPLHLAALQRLPQIVLILVEEEKTDVLKTDESGRTALHYACQNGKFTPLLPSSCSLIHSLLIGDIFHLSETAEALSC
jgi:ankyrin repeat protein